MGGGRRKARASVDRARPDGPDGADGPFHCRRRIFDLGVTAPSNSQLADFSTRTGLVLDVVRATAAHESGKSSGIHFVRALATRMRLSFGGAFDRVFRMVKRYEQQDSVWCQPSLNVIFEQVEAWADASSIRRGGRPVFPDVAEAAVSLAELLALLLEPWSAGNASDEPELRRRGNVGSYMDPWAPAEAEPATPQPEPGPEKPSTPPPPPPAPDTGRRLRGIVRARPGRPPPRIGDSLSGKVKAMWVIDQRNGYQATGAGEEAASANPS
ncbi:MAG: hypothetical protein M1832_000360 [Thelocarpon impressellum]|nr:MAG: hypothetical protein M1832_000360 [Thelocarpon impressellum]